jgi:hypothetical protein
VGCDSLVGARYEVFVEPCKDRAHRIVSASCLATSKTDTLRPTTSIAWRRW